jgi:NADPH-dependent glutamate synthase beta subunit-like oxidoreductase
MQLLPRAQCVLPSFSRVPTAGKVNQPTNKTPVVAIIGAGPAGGTCAEKLREQGFLGRIFVRLQSLVSFCHNFTILS